MDQKSEVLPLVVVLLQKRVAISVNQLGENHILDLGLQRVVEVLVEILRLVVLIAHMHDQPEQKIRS